MTRSQRRAQERLENKVKQKAESLRIRAMKAANEGDQEALQQMRKDIVNFKLKYYKKP